MARVCRGWFPKTDGFYMDDNLKMQIDIMIKNVVKDWDFTILFSGQGEMRVGKSLIAMQMGAYWTYEIERIHKVKVPFNTQENIVFNGIDLVKKGMKLGKKYNYACLDYDEAADDMETSKVMTGSARYIKDYLRKAAQFNMLNLIIQSEFFEVPKPIAISRSACLIDVTYNSDEVGNFRRGYGRFYSRRGKKKLYLLGKKMLDYHVVQPDFKFTFPNFYPVDEKIYREHKRECLMKWTKVSASEQRWRAWVNGAIKVLHVQGLSHREIANKISETSKIPISHMTVGRILAEEEVEDDE